MAKKVIDYPGVNCDLCNESYPEGDTRSGGYYFSSYAVCPKCADNFMKTIVDCNEEEFVTQRCKPDQSFRDFVVNDLRGGKPSSITITTLD